eukprot:EC787019.1.p1 GENE.EC787019.1~~EC787019.1.p1  ORF type:complete len:134 (+),score=52.73 EC787019.1:51-452(+)
MSYKKKYTLEERSTGAADIRQKFPTRIPVIVEKDRRCRLPDIDRTKYLLPGDLLFSQFIQVVRKRIEMPPTHALYLFVGTMLMPTGSALSAIYEEHKEEDGFLYIVYSDIETLGGGDAQEEEEEEEREFVEGE